jgi:hypothetical protein
MRFEAILSVVAISASLSTAWTPVPTHITRRHAALYMAIDYNDPVVAEEFQNVQPMSWEEVEEELMSSGVRAPQTMNDMELKLMLVEMRLRLAGKLGGDGKPKQRPTTFSSKFEEAMWTKPAFEAFYEELKKQGDHNAMNVVAEFLNTPDVAAMRYSTSYGQLLADCDAALRAPPPVKSPTILFSGFPANMGEGALKMTLEALGPIVDMECTQDDDFPVFKGKVTFEDIETAKKAVEQYNGLDMGMGTLLEMSSV